MNRTAKLQQTSTTHVAATADSHVAGIFRVSGKWQGQCQCGAKSELTTDLKADAWTVTHKRQMRTAK